jgi:hypothetical protein
MVKTNYVFGNQSLEWSYEYTQIIDSPKFTDDGNLRVLTSVCKYYFVGFHINFKFNIFYLKIQEKKYFEKNRNIEKTILIKDRQAAQVIFLHFLLLFNF